MANSILNSLWDVIFPPFCVACNNPGEWWCESCRGGVHLVRDGICPKCLTAGEHECVGNLPFAEVVSCGFYHDAKLRALITRLKFSGVTVVASDLRLFLQERVLVDVPVEAVLMPMPLSQKRLKERGFNQAEFIAWQMKEAYRLPNRIDTGLLERIKHGDPLSSLEHDLALRSGQVKGAFRVRFAPLEHVVLVDDVATTGATAGEAARVLLAAGAKRVDLLTLAIGA